MYYYVLDQHNVPQKDFERKQTELQSLLTEFRISGEVAKVTPLRTIRDLLDTAVARGAKTLVACGTDETFHQTLACIGDRDFTLAFIPFVENTQLGNILGLKDIQLCVKTIASRRIEKIDAAKINNSYFISYLELGAGTQVNKRVGFFSLLKQFSNAAAELKMRIDDSYYVNSKTIGGLLINTRGTAACMGGPIGNPQDSFLDLLLIEKLSPIAVLNYKNEIRNGCYEKIPRATSIRCRKVEFLEPAGHKIYIDGKEVAKFPATVELVSAKLKMIVGKNRTF